MTSGGQRLSSDIPEEAVERLAKELLLFRFGGKVVGGRYILTLPDMELRHLDQARDNARRILAEDRLDLRKQGAEEERERLRQLVPHEIACACGRGDRFESKGHDEDCPRREVDDMLAALDTPKSDV